VDVPQGFRRWRFHWFECPACGHRDWRAYANVNMPREPRRILWRFWCERCGAFAALQQRAMPTINALIILFLLGPVAFTIVYRALLAGLSFESLVAIFGVVWLLQPLVFLALTKLAYRYVPAT
jgi:predicted RNA-binding Zn-ribbon protein involved in translation (DUF1610 family)